MTYSTPKYIAKIIFTFSVLSGVFVGCSKDDSHKASDKKPRVIVSSDIGGSDPDDFQSMIHYLMYADKFQTEGLISSPPGKGRKEDIITIIDLYEKDLPELKKHGEFPNADTLRTLAKQGAKEAAPPQGWSRPTEGSQWIIKRARIESERPLWILVWGGLEDLAQALHDAPDIESKIRVYWIGGPNKKWSINSYVYLARNFPKLWTIEANATYRGWFYDAGSKAEWTNDEFYINKIKDKGAMGTDFGNYYKGSLKMGDTPSVAYLLHGNPDDPGGESWGGSFIKLDYSAFRKFQRHTALTDTVPTYSIMEWEFEAEKVDSTDTVEIWLDIAGQRIDGFYKGDGIYVTHFVPKESGTWKYVINGTSKKLKGQSGEFVSADPWPGPQSPEDVRLESWWSDKVDNRLFLNHYQGAKTVSKWREAYLSDWATRLSWLIE